MNNLPKVVTEQCDGRESNSSGRESNSPQPLGYKPHIVKALATPELIRPIHCQSLLFRIYLLLAASLSYRKSKQ